MATKQGDLELLNDPVAQKLLQSTIPARLAYVWTDGSPRVVPIWFHWNGNALVMGTPVLAPKMHVLEHGAKVCLSIDSNEWPYKALTIRGTAKVNIVDGVVPEYAMAAERYFGKEQGQGWVTQVGQMSKQMARIVVEPEWVGILDFEQRFPSAIEKAMATMAGATPANE